MSLNLNQIEVASVNKAKISVEKVLNNFWKETNSKLDKLNINSMQIKSETIEFDFNLNHFEFNRNSFTPICTNKLVKQVDKDNQEPIIDRIKLSKRQKIKRTQIQQGVHLIKRHNKKYCLTQKAKLEKSSSYKSKVLKKNKSPESTVNREVENRNIHRRKLRFINEERIRLNFF